MGTCDRENCHDPTTHEIGFLLRADTQHEPAETWLGLCVCGSHRQTLILADVLCDEGWELICKQFAAAGRATPSRPLARLLFRHLDPERQNEQSFG